MTRTFEHVNTSCVNFTYNCEPYPIVNTGGCSKASPRGVDRSDESDHHQSHVGWEASPVHNKLGENNSRPMGLASLKGVPTKTGSTALATKTDASNKLLGREEQNDLHRDHRTPVQRCSGRDHTFPGRICITNLPGRKEGGGTEAGNKPKGTQHIRETRTFQNGGTTHPPRPHPTGGLDDKIGSEGCLPSDTNPHRASTPPPVPMGKQNLPISVSPIRVDICPTSFPQNNETCSGSTSAHGHTSSHIPRRHSGSASVNGGTGSVDSTDLPALQGSGTGSQSEEIYTDSTPESGVLGLPSRHSQPTAHFPIREVEENTAASPTPPSPTKCFGERPSEVCGEGLSLDTGYMASSSAFQSTAVFNQLCVSGEPSHGDREHCQKVQHPLDLDQRGQGQPRMVVCSRQEDPNAISSPTPGTNHDNRVRCLQHGVGSSTRRVPDGWKMVPRGNLSPHKLSRTTSCLSSAVVLCQAQQRDHRPNEVGQCHGGDIHQQARGNALPGTLSARTHDLGLVCTEGCFSGCKTPTREGQYNSRSGIAINEGSL